MVILFRYGALIFLFSVPTIMHCTVKLLKKIRVTCTKPTSSPKQSHQFFVVVLNSFQLVGFLLCYVDSEITEESAMSAILLFLSGCIWKRCKVLKRQPDVFYLNDAGSRIYGKEKKYHELGM